MLHSDEVIVRNYNRLLDKFNSLEEFNDDDEDSDVLSTLNSKCLRVGRRAERYYKTHKKLLDKEVFHM